MYLRPLDIPDKYIPRTYIDPFADIGRDDGCISTGYFCFIWHDAISRMDIDPKGFIFSAMEMKLSRRPFTQYGFSNNIEHGNSHQISITYIKA